MNKKKKEELRKKRGLLNADEHLQRRKASLLKSYQKNPKNKGKKKFNDN